MTDCTWKLPVNVEPMGGRAWHLWIRSVAPAWATLFSLSTASLAGCASQVFPGLLLHGFRTDFSKERYTLYENSSGRGHPSDRRWANRTASVQREATCISRPAGPRQRTPIFR
jgi:hypothetical protein